MSSLFLKKVKIFEGRGILIEYANNVAGNGGKGGKKKTSGSERAAGTKKRRERRGVRNGNLPDRFPPKNFPVWNPRLSMLGKSAVKQCKRKRRKSSCGVVFIITDYFISKCLSSAACFFFVLHDPRQPQPSQRQPHAPDFNFLANPKIIQQPASTAMTVMIAFSILILRF